MVTEPESAFSIAEAVIEKLNQLPQEQQQETLDFVEFLAEKYAKKLLKKQITGLHKGKIWISDDFNEPLSDELGTNVFLYK